MRLSRGYSMTFLSLVLCGCNGHLQSFDDMMKALMPPANLTAQAQGKGLARMTQAQTQALHTALTRPLNEGLLSQARAESAKDLEKILIISACYGEHNPQTLLRRYSTPEKYMFDVPMWRTTYHPRTKCLTVTRLDSWKMLARNAFSFRAVFVSEESAESAQMMYEMRRQPDGVWLLD